MNFYIRQTKGAELGNFVNTTPTIKQLFYYFNEKIPVLFETKYIEELYKDWSYIQVVDEATVFKNSLRQIIRTCDALNPNIPEYKTRLDETCKRLGIVNKTYPSTYAPEFESNITGDYAVIARGCIDHNPSVWESAKEVGDDVFKYIMEKIDIPIYIVGNTKDYNRSLNRMKDYNKDVTYILDDIRKVASIINGCKYMISNDTGLMHVGGALNKEIFAIWKDTPFEKNVSTSNTLKYSKKGNWYTDFDKWFENRKVN